VGVRDVDLWLAPAPAIMSAETLCQICEAAPASHQCRRCGALVCDDHYDREIGLCVDCAAQVRDTRRDR
jgi:hypothetical protein